MSATDTSAAATRLRRPGPAARLDRAEILFAVAAFAALCAIALSFAPRLVEPDDHAYQASIVGITQGHWLSLSTAQADALGRQLSSPGSGGQSPTGASALVQWVQLPDGRWISEKDPGYPFLAAPFQALGIIRLAPLFYGALGCLGLFFGGRRWLGRCGGGAAVGLFCTSGAALLFAWRDYMPTFTDASLIAAGTGALLWAVLAAEATMRRRTWAGLAGFAALEAAAFTRYTDIVVLGCAVIAAVVAWRLRKIPAPMLAWWVGSAVVFGASLGGFDSLVYGGPLKSGYRPGEIQFSLSSIGPNLRYMPAHLLEAMPMLLLALAAIVWIIARWARLRRFADSPAGTAHADAAATALQADGPAAVARRDFAVGLALAASWASIWGLYSAYTWTANDFVSTLQSARFYVPALGAIALLGAWLLVRVPRRSSLAAAISLAVVAAMLGLGVWSFGDMRVNQGPGVARILRVPGGVLHGGLVPGQGSGGPPGT
jgi:hypothetical protein